MSLDGLLAALAGWIAGFLTRRRQRAAQDAAAIGRDRRAWQAARDAGANAPRSRAALRDGVRDGTDF